MNDGLRTKKNCTLTIYRSDPIYIIHIARALELFIAELVSNAHSTAVEQQQRQSSTTLAPHHVYDSQPYTYIHHLIMLIYWHIDWLAHN